MTDLYAGARRAAGGLYVALFYLFALGPLIAILVMSVNSAVAFPSSFKSPTLDWYRSLLNDQMYLHAMWISLLVALLAGALATLLGVPLGYALERRRFKGRGVLDGLVSSPLLVPELGIALALLEMFTVIGVPLGVAPLVLAHGVFIMPFVVRSVVSGLSAADPALEDAASDLGAGRLRTFFLVTIPIIRSSIVAGFVLAAIVSFINVPLSFFLVTPDETTLPILVMAQMGSNLSPVLAAVAGMTVGVVVVVSLVLEKVFRIRLLT